MDNQECADQLNRIESTRRWARAAVILLAIYGASRALRALRLSAERSRGTDEASDLYVLNPNIERPERDDRDYEKNAASFDAASAAE